MFLLKGKGLPVMNVVKQTMLVRYCLNNNLRYLCHFIYLHSVVEVKHSSLNIYSTVFVIFHKHHRHGLTVNELMVLKNSFLLHSEFILNSTESITTRCKLRVYSIPVYSKCPYSIMWENCRSADKSPFCFPHSKNTEWR